MLFRSLIHQSHTLRRFCACPGALAIAACRRTSLTLLAVLGGALGYSLLPTLQKYPKLLAYIKPLSEKYLWASGYRQIGLLCVDQRDRGLEAYSDSYDDLIQEENDTVQKALTRLTPRQQYDRAYRLKVAAQCSLLHRELPKE